MSKKRELAEAAYEEWQKRVSFYPGMIRAGKMKMADADRRIRLMHEIYRFIMRSPDEAFIEPETSTPG